MSKLTETQADDLWLQALCLAELYAGYSQPLFWKYYGIANRLLLWKLNRVVRGAEG